MSSDPVQSDPKVDDNEYDGKKGTFEQTANATNPPAQKNGFIQTLLWPFKKLQLDFITVLLMVKGSLPPVIILSMYQADSIAKLLGSLGYLSAIISIFSFAMLPRARFIQGIVANAIAAGLASGIGMLVIYSSVKARQHTTPVRNPSSSTTGPANNSLTLASVPYNAAASTVCAVYYFFIVYIINVVRNVFPQILIPAMLASIVATVACVNAPMLPTLAFGYSFMTSLLKAIYLGLAVGTGVSLIFVPISSRTLVYKQFTGLLTSFQGCLKAYKALSHSLESEEAVDDLLVVDKALRPEVASVLTATQAALNLHAKLQVDLPFAKREAGIGTMGADELKELNKLSRYVMLPILGLSSIPDILKNVASVNDWKEENLKDLSEEKQNERARGIQDWTANMRLVRASVDEIIDIMIDGIDHIMYQLQFKKRPKSSQTGNSEDIEGKPDTTAPGSPGFAAYLDAKSTAFYSTKHVTMIEWGKRRGIQFPDDFFENPNAELVISDDLKTAGEARRRQNQRQLYLLLYVEFLLYSTARNLLDLVIWTDKLVESGLLRNRLIIPSIKRMRKLFSSVFTKSDLGGDDSAIRDVDNGANQVYLGSAYYANKNPEHLPPRNKWEAFGDNLHKIPEFLRSPSSAFGLRVACASMSLGLLIFLRQTQRFSNENRVFWAVIMIAISMSPTSGQSLFGFILRAAATFVAMLVSWIIYYVAGNGKVPGIIVLYWFFVACGLYFPLRMPQLQQAGMIVIITITLIIGYELEAIKVGQAVLSRSGQSYIGIVKFGPIRLATVLAGLFVAFIWTIFPYTMSEHSNLRRDMAASLYLLANYYSIVHETVSSRIRRLEGNLDDKNSPGRRLESARLKAFNKQILLLSNMKMYSQFTTWEISLGGRFPKKIYDELITSIENITRYMSLVAFASHVYRDDEGPDGFQWSQSFRSLITDIRPTQHDNVMLLSLLSGAMRDGRPLPPFVARPEKYALSDKLEALDSDILSVRHVNEPGYAAFAVMQLAARSVSIGLDKILGNVKELVGELDFSIHVVKEESSQGSDISDDKGKRKDD